MSQAAAFCYFLTIPVLARSEGCCWVDTSAWIEWLIRGNYRQISSHLTPLQIIMGASTMRRSILFVLLVSYIIGVDQAFADPLDIKMVPFLSAIQRNLLFKDYADAGMKKGQYTLAVSPQGTWQSFFSDTISAEDRARNVLERCEHITKARCLMAYENGRMTNERTPRPAVMRYPTEFDPMQIPFISSKLRQQIKRAYLGLNPDKAIAFDSIGDYGVSYGQSDEATARKLTLENCESKSGGKTCFVYSINETVIFNKNTKIN